MRLRLDFHERQACLLRVKTNERDIKQEVTETYCLVFFCICSSGEAMQANRGVRPACGEGLPSAAICFAVVFGTESVDKKG